MVLRRRLSALMFSMYVGYSRQSAVLCVCVPVGGALVDSQASCRTNRLPLRRGERRTHEEGCLTGRTAADGTDRADARSHVRAISTIHIMNHLAHHEQS
jgi:hypothetical protein